MKKIQKKIWEIFTFFWWILEMFENKFSDLDIFVSWSTNSHKPLMMHLRPVSQNISLLDLTVLTFIGHK